MNDAPPLNYSTCVQEAAFWERRIRYAFKSRRNPRFRADLKFSIPKFRQWLDELKKHNGGKLCWVFDVL